MGFEREQQLMQHVGLLWHHLHHLLLAGANGLSQVHLTVVGTLEMMGISVQAGF